MLFAQAMQEQIRRQVAGGVGGKARSELSVFERSQHVRQRREASSLKARDNLQRAAKFVGKAAVVSKMLFHMEEPLRDDGLLPNPFTNVKDDAASPLMDEDQEDDSHSLSALMTIIKKMEHKLDQVLECNATKDIHDCDRALDLARPRTLLDTRLPCFDVEKHGSEAGSKRALPSDKPETLV
jgi:hypothetical protein